MKCLFSWMPATRLTFESKHGNMQDLIAVHIYRFSGQWDRSEISFSFADILFLDAAPEEAPVRDATTAGGICMCRQIRTKLHS